jgi:hypothetical protein
MGARCRLFSAVFAVSLVVACATGGDEDAVDSGGPSSDTDTGAPHGDGSSEATGSAGSGHTNDSGGSGSAEDSPADEASMVDNFVPPEDVYIPIEVGTPDSGPKDAGPKDSGPKDAGPKDAAPKDAPVDSGPTPTCNPFKIKYAMEYDDLDGGATPCSAGCPSGDCCWHLASPPACLPK